MTSTKYLLSALVEIDIWITEIMSIPTLLEMNSLATAKKYYVDSVSINHLIIVCYDFLSDKDFDLNEFRDLYQTAIDNELSRKDRRFETPSVPDEIMEMIQGCQSKSDVHSLLMKISSDFKAIKKDLLNSSDSNVGSEPKPVMANGFHIPIGEETGLLPKYMQDKRISVVVISPYLNNGEKYIWDGPYNTADPVISTRFDQSQGRLFVTNQRILFWSDDKRKPHVGLYYLDIDDWKSSWMPLKSRGVALIAEGRKVIFVANVNAVKHAEETYNSYRFKRKAMGL